eukprot:NODE_793_length_3856_cov_0.643865.p1 type:complete len:759 gc:universal NODE_793_length_3856_cov_0.643865:2439-163(-)
MRVFVAEKPSIAKGVTQILSNNHFYTTDGWKWCKNFKFDISGEQIVMTSVTGHVMEIEFQNNALKKWESCDPISLMSATVEKSVNSEMKGIASNLERLARNCTELVILTDNDREGEYIGWEIVHIMSRIKRFPVKRMRFSVVQNRQIWSAYHNLTEIDNLQVNAVECRMELDLRIGAAYTRFLTLSLRRFLSERMILSYGSCQFPTLGFVVKRYLERQGFISENFYFLEAKVKKDKILHNFSWSRNHLFDKSVVEAIYEYLIDKKALILSVEKKHTSKWAPLPLTTVEMQKAGSRLLRISSANIMKIAEKLYQQGLISYPRTETDEFEKDFNLRDLIEIQKSDPDYQNHSIKLLDGAMYRFPRKGKHNDKAHPPIHPTGKGSHLTGNERKVFNFISRRFLACCSKDATGFQTSVRLGIDIETFLTAGLEVLERNYLDIYQFDKWESKEIASFAENEQVLFELGFKSGKTTAPQLLTEADLIGLMDNNGIGTDATMHDHISKIFTRNYVQNSGKFIIPTQVGLALVEGLDGIQTATNLSEPHLRSQLESKLGNICTGMESKDVVLRQMIQEYTNVYRLMEQDRSNIEGIFRNKITERIRRDDDGDSDADSGNDHAPFGAATRNNTTKSKASSSTKAEKTTNYFSDSKKSSGEFRCDCGLIAAEKTSNTENNRNRKFFVCAKSSNSAKCKFFLWADEEEKPRKARGGKNVISVSKSNENSGYKCFICADPSHMANVCPNRDKKRKSSTKQFKRSYKKKKL